MLENLDIFACWGSCAASRVISYGTSSLFGPKRLKFGPSHVAMSVYLKPFGYVWLESTSLCTRPCLYHNVQKSGIQVHRPVDRIDDYLNQGGRIDVYRLTQIDRVHSCETSKLTEVCWDLIYANASYDLGHALISGTRVFKYSRLLPGADLEQLFCSELCAAILQAMGRMNRIDPGVYNPACLLRTLIRQGTYRFLTDKPKDIL